VVYPHIVTEDYISCVQARESPSVLNLVTSWQLFFQSFWLSLRAGQKSLQIPVVWNS